MTATLQRARPVRTYQTMIARILVRRSLLVDPRHIEAWMRLECEHGLDALSVTKFERELDLAVMLIAASGVKESERLALSYGL